jgi:hypothetical protein
LPLPYETKGAELILFFAEFSYTAFILAKKLMAGANPVESCIACGKGF